MSDTSIEWVRGADGQQGKTWNPLGGCSEISPGCVNCYAATMARRLEAMGQEKYVGTTKTLANGKVAWTGKISLDVAALEIPLKRKKPTTWFVNSMSDLFHEDVTLEFQTDVFEVMAKASQHTFQVLTKRACLMMSRMSDIATGVAYRLGKQNVPGFWPLPNVWLGVSVENRKYADERIPYLLKTRAAVRFLSCEPLLGPIDFSKWIGYEYCGGLLDCVSDGIQDMHRSVSLDQIIVGGESGQGARPMRADWVRSIRDQCVAVGVSFFFKQWGAWEPRCEVDSTYPYNDAFVEPDGKFRMAKDALPSPNALVMRYVGKKSSGRLLDGREWNEMPEVSPGPQ